MSIKPPLPVTKDVPMPTPTEVWETRWHKYPWRSCTERGMSFFVPGGTRRSMRKNVAAANTRWAPWRFEAMDRQHGEPVVENGVAGVRVWRVV